MNQVKLSKLVEQVQDAIQCRLDNQYYWVSAQISGIKKYEPTRRCYLTLGEFENGTKVAEIKAVFWSAGYDEIAKFEKLTGQQFKDGIEVVCRVMVRFNKVYGLNVEVFEISIAHTIGTLELQKKQTIERLINERHAAFIDGSYKTYNNQKKLPVVIKNIALITAPNSDGQRDFIQEITKNRHGYNFRVKEFFTTIQGESAHLLIIEQLKAIEKLISDKRWVWFDAVAIVRGGGSDSDLKPFDNYELAKYVANFPIPVFTGIGHDRNQSIVDLMAREQKTPTKVAAVFVEHNFATENKFIDLCTKFFGLVNHKVQKAKDKLETIKPNIIKQAEREIRVEKLKLKALKAGTFKAADGQVRKSFLKFTELKSGVYKTAEGIIKRSKDSISAIGKLIRLSDPQTILNRGFAIVTFNNKTVTDASEVEGGVEIQARLKNGIIYSTVIRK